MKIETELNVNDRQWVIRNGNIEEVKITKINIYVSDIVSSIVYKVDWCETDNNLYGQKEMHEMYKTKRDAGIAMLRANGLDCGLVE